MPMGMVGIRGQGFVVGRRQAVEVYKMLDNY
jgi:hypothetical protein